MLLLEKRGETLLYTGDFKLGPNLTAEACIVPKADTLIIETTYGVPKYAFPPISEVKKEILQFCHETIDDHRIPVLFGYSLGKAQEALKCLEGSGLKILLHPQVLKMTQACEEIGFTFPAYSEFRYEEAKECVVIAPPLPKDSKWLTGIRNHRTAMLSGWALDS
jgi:Cft2 family RNA processing exonuclease